MLLPRTWRSSAVSADDFHAFIPDNSHDPAAKENRLHIIQCEEYVQNNLPDTITLKSAIISCAILKRHCLAFTPVSALEKKTHERQDRDMLALVQLPEGGSMLNSNIQYSH